MMQRSAGDDSNGMHNIVTGDENWIHCYNLETKRQSAQWVFPFEELPTKVKRGRNIGNYTVAIFFGIKDHGATIVLDDKKKQSLHTGTLTTVSLVLRKSSRKTTSQ
ncbi:hypothetical protein EVAR_103104_1 [Eumeta japonica]|uniref:Uncharacterized protein n=1 Tax=Eumeta variegata TaxID=151549 RepID=A0A4C1WQR0_EUMVA|nr:hypothetical protein EVAR_103104_1 [Eumeta japonica]